MDLTFHGNLVQKWNYFYNISVQKLNNGAYNFKLKNALRISLKNTCQNKYAYWIHPHTPYHNEHIF